MENVEIVLQRAQYGYPFRYSFGGNVGGYRECGGDNKPFSAFLIFRHGKVSREAE